MSSCVEEYEKSSKATRTNEFIKIHETPKSDPLIIGTKRRVNILKTVIERFKIENHGKQTIKYTSQYSGEEEEYLLELGDIEYSLHGGNKANMIIKSNQLDKLCHLIETSKDSLVSEIILTYNNLINNFDKLIDDKSANEIGRAHV